ncbi:MAG: SH3 domain-containing protein, partial [Anaerolineae bacterium]|nr:SH3 domain-containing protein [Anaerolineae bacterium]
MQYLRSRFGVVIVMILTVVAVNSPFQQAPGVQAQDGGDQCAELALQALAEAGETCAGLADSMLCAGHASVTAVMIEGAPAADSALIDLAAVDGITTAAANPATGEWGVAMFTLPVTQPEGGSRAVTAVLYGNAQIMHPTETAAEQVTLTITNDSGGEVNLRNGAGVFYDTVGVFAADQQLQGDGRNEQGDWVRVVLEERRAWVFTRLVNWDGDLTALPVLAPDDVTPPFEASAPFQAFNLMTGAVSDMCPSTPSGLLLQFTGETPAVLMINDVRLVFADATLLVRATPAGDLQVAALSGSGTITARGFSQDIANGEYLTVTLGGEDGLRAVDT